MSLRVAALLASLFIFSTFVVAQINAPNCNSTSWQWTFNSLGQNPCTILAYMMSTCNGGQYTVFQLQSGWVYFGPSGIDNANLCECSTVGYSLYSACGACQEQEWVTWSQWVTNCTKTLPPSSFPNPVPSQIHVPQWVLLDVTNENLWNASKSYSVGDSPELGPGAVLGPSPTPSPPVNHNSNTGAIVGGVVGGVAAISIAVAVIFFYLRRRRRSRAPSAAAPGVGASQPPVDEIKQPLTEEGTNTGSSLLLGTSSMSGTPGAPMRLYDPNDPTTFPGYQGALQSPATAQGLVPTHNGTRNSLATTQASRPQGYHSLPAV
ncbi:hypothetical protein V8E52_004543 [Russula decolorans]